MRRSLGTTRPVSKKRSPQSVVDLTLSDDNEDDQAGKLGGVRTQLAQSRLRAAAGRSPNSASTFLHSRKSNRSKRAKVNHEPSSSSAVIHIDCSSEEDDDGGGKLGPTSTAFSNSASRVSSASSRSTSDARENSDDDDVEVVNPTAPSFVPAAARMPSSISDTQNDNDDDVVLMGQTNAVALPHMRQHCTECKFDANQVKGTGKLSKEAIETNCKHCDRCFCYVCDLPAKECANWKSSVGILFRTANHCCATDKVDFWKDCRTTKKKLSRQQEGIESDSDADDSSNDHDDFGYGRFGGYGNYYFSDDSFEYSPYVPPTSKDPLPPSDVQASKDETLTKCRKCGWYIDFFHKNFSDKYSINRGGCSGDWCHKCGRIASEKDFGKNQLKAYVPKNTDVLLGEKTIPFRIRSHDPRLFEEYKKTWEDQGNATGPRWNYDQKEMDADMFNHCLGRYPKVDQILSLIPVLPEDKIPKTGVVTKSGKSISHTEVSADETQAILLENRHHRFIFHLLHQIGGFTSGSDHQCVKGDVEATWNKSNQSGTLKVRMFLSPRAFTSTSDRDRSNLTLLLGVWFDVFPYAISDLCDHLEAKMVDTKEYLNGTVNLRVPPFKLKETDARVEAANTEQEVQVQGHNACVEAYRSKLALTSSSGSDDIGGTCDNASNVELSGVLKRYFRETLARTSAESYEPTRNLWLEASLGVESFHRAVNSGHTTSRPSLSESTWDCLVGNPSSSTLLDALNFRNSRCVRRVRTNYINSFLENIENLGHAEVDFVDGLNVELLAFQRQSVQWALERERVVGGIESLFWAPIPDTTFFFNPMLGKFRKDKPKVIRGGFIAEEMGLGKTVISLALILQNPAPAFPRSGSPIASLNGLQSVSASASQQPAWDRSLYAQTSESNKRRGSIISRGTLVVCPVSLVGQWIEEAKSKLKNPGLVYPYHGQNRKRDANILSKNAIVVTTFQVLASDKTYHAKKSSSDDYCAPVEQVRWWRIIFDEGHCLREAQTTKYKACADLVGDHKWLVSGTPINTSVSNLKSQIKLLGLSSVDEMFRAMPGILSSPNASRRRRNFYEGNTEQGMSHLLFLTRNIMIRHTQNQKYRGTPTTLMSLPEKTERVVKVAFSKAELAEYKRLEKAALSFYVNFKRSHGRTLSKHVLKISQKLTPMRVACSGGKYPLENVTLDDSGDVEEDDENEDSNPEHDRADGMKGKKAKKEVKYSNFEFTSKFTKLISELKRARDEDPTSKSLVFSQYASTLEWLQKELPKHGFQFRTLSGDMSMSKRAKALHDFQSDPPTTIFLLSMRAGAVGINLTQANRVFLMEPSLNPALELQAIGRVHRLGQKRKVEIVRIVIKNTIETRLMKVLKQKYGNSSPGTTGTATATAATAAAASAFTKKSETEEETGGDTAGRDTNNNAATTTTTTTAAAIVGCVSSDRTTILTEEFDLLFGDDSGSATSSSASSSSTTTVKSEI